MKFILINSPEKVFYEKNKESDLSQNTLLKKKNFLNSSFSIPQIINNLNNNPILNPLTNQHIPIFFEDFNLLGKAKIFFKDLWQQEKFKQDIGFYDPNDKTIHIFNGVIKEGQRTQRYNPIFKDFLNNLSDENFSPKFFLLHEIGHAIHDHVKNNNANNLTDYFKKESSILLNNDLFTICNENFADSFAAITLLTIEKNNPNIVKDLKSLIEHRNNTIDHDYFTANTLDKIIKDHEQNNLNYNSFNEIKNYVLNLTDITLRERIKEGLEINHKAGRNDEVNRRLGYLSGKFNKNINTIVPFLEQETSYIHRSEINMNSFEHGLEQYSQEQKEILKKSTQNRIFACRDSFLKDHSTNSNRPTI